METVSTEAKQEIVGALRQRYEQASKWEKGRILTEFASVSGYHRKYAIRLLNLRRQTKMRPPVKKSQRLYDEAVKTVLLTIWETADRICGKRLKAVIPNLVGAMEKYGHLKLDAGAHLTFLQSWRVTGEVVPERGLTAGKDRLLFFGTLL